MLFLDATCRTKICYNLSQTIKIDGETEHMAWEAQYLNYIDKLGYENFLTMMV